MPLTTRLLALCGEVPVSPLFRQVLRAVIGGLQRQGKLTGLDSGDRMAVYEQRDAIYLAALADQEQLYPLIEQVLIEHLGKYAVDPEEALRTLALDRALAPRYGEEHQLEITMDRGARELHDALQAMELPDYSTHEDPSYVSSVISSKLIKEVENAEESAIKDFYKAVDSNEDFEEKTRRFNDFCHDLRALISNDANT